MYVRWNRKKRTKDITWVKEEGDFLYAVLVENTRIDGKPRQKSIKYLGGIGERQNTYTQIRFWEHADQNLSAIYLDGSTRNKIIDKLKEKVPRPSEEELSAWRELRRKRLEEIEKGISKKGSAYKREQLSTNVCTIM